MNHVDVSASSRITRGSAEFAFLSPSDARWASMIECHPEANFFHHPAWIDVLARCYHYQPSIAAVCDDRGMIRAGVPMMRVSSPLTGRRLVSLPFTDYCIPLTNDAGALAALTEELACRCQQHKSPPVEVRWELPSHPAFECHQQYVLQAVPLDPDPDLVLKRFRRTNRQNITTAEKRGVRVVRGADLEHMRLYYRLQVETRQRHGVPAQPWRFFKILADTLFDRGLAHILLAYRDDECLAGAVILAWKRAIICKYAASRTDTLNLRPNNLIFWTAIRWGCENGYTTFDMGRSEVENAGLRRYKKGWGAEEVPLAYTTLSSQSAPCMDSPLFRFTQAVIKHTPCWVCELIGRLMYRHFG